MVIPCLCSFYFALTYVSGKAAPAAASFLLDVPTLQPPRAKQQPTGLIAYPASQGRPVLVPNSPCPIRTLEPDATKKPLT